jgi:3-oxoacyl-[acyl-carrier protein] reductase
MADRRPTDPRRTGREAEDSAGNHQGCALVTGAAGGIGAATARALAGDGWPVGVCYRSDAEGAARVTAEVEAAGGQAAALEGDLTAPDAAEALFADLEERFGPVLVLVNNAGMRADGLSPKLGDEQWQQVIETNLSAAFRTTRRALGPMLRARFGRIVNIASVVGPRANAGQANYAASKAGLIGFTKTVAVEVARRGVTVNAVAPCFVETALTADVSNGVVDAIPARRAGTPEDVAACVRFLASDDAAYVTGTTLTVDGGMSA